MGPALQARKDGYGVTLLFVDDIEPEYQTVLDGTYPLRRPVVFVMNANASPVAQAFLEYVLSPQGQRAIKIGASGLFQDKTSFGSINITRSTGNSPRLMANGVLLTGSTIHDT